MIKLPLFLRFLIWLDLFLECSWDDLCRLVDKLESKYYDKNICRLCQCDHQTKSEEAFVWHVSHPEAQYDN